MDPLDDSTGNKPTAEESEEGELLENVLADAEDASTTNRMHGEFGRKFMDELTSGGTEEEEAYLDNDVEPIGEDEMEDQDNAELEEMYDEGSESGEYEIEEEGGIVDEYGNEIQLLDSDPGEEEECDFVSDDSPATEKSADKQPEASKTSVTSKKAIDAMLVQRKRHLPVVSKLNPAIPTKPVEIDHDFVLPPAGDIRSKIQVAVAPFVPHEPTCRPSLDLPLPGIELKGAILNPYIELYTKTLYEYSISGKISGAIFFTPETTWPEDTGRVCLFYYFWNSNSGEWTRTEFVTVKIEQGKETKIRFVFSVDTKIYAEQKDGISHPRKSLLNSEKVSIAAVVGAEGVLHRSNESCIDFGQTWKLTDHSKKSRLVPAAAAAAAAPRVIYPARTLPALKSMSTQTDGKCNCPFPSEQEN